MLIYATLVTFGAAAVASATGFGFNLLGAPLLAFVYPVDTVVEATLILGILVSGILMAQPSVWRGTDWRLVGRLFSGSLAGMPLDWFCCSRGTRASSRC